MTPLREVMSSSVTTMDQDATVADAAARMVQGRIGSILVTHKSMLLGIFTERDVMRAAAKSSDLQVDTLATAERQEVFPIDELVEVEAHGRAEVVAHVRSPKSLAECWILEPLWLTTSPIGSHVAE